MRLRVQNPLPQYRWAAGTAPYCVGEGGPTTNYGVQPYRVTADGLYEYTGGGGVPTPQLPCLYLPSELLSPDVTENGALFVPTWINTRVETLNGSTAAIAPGGPCSGLQSPACTYNVTSQQASFVRDVGLATLLIDHSFSSTVRIARNSVVMDGDLLDLDGKSVDVCSSYTRIGQPCPANITVGVAGTNDIIPLQALLNAAGVTNLDQVAGTLPNLRTRTRRSDGVVILLQVRERAVRCDASQYSLGARDVSRRPVRCYPALPVCAAIPPRVLALCLRKQVQYTNYYLAGFGVPRGTGSFNGNVVQYFYTVRALTAGHAS